MSDLDQTGTGDNLIGLNSQQSDYAVQEQGLKHFSILIPWQRRLPDENQILWLQYFSD